MLRKWILTAAAAVAMTAVTNVPAFAAGWQQDGTGWWYGTNEDNSTYYSNSWQWIDGNGDGIAECYYFNENGYILANTTTPDGYTVNADGAWTENGIIKTQGTALKKGLADMIGKWNLTEVKAGWLNSPEQVNDLNNFTNVQHWSDWHTCFTGMNPLELNHDENGYYYVSLGGNVYLSETENGGLTRQNYTYLFLDGDHLVVTSTANNFITNAKDKSGTYFLGYYTRQ